LNFNNRFVDIFHIIFIPFRQYNGFDLHELLGIPTSHRIGIMVGNLCEAKGFDLLVDACSKLRQDNPYCIVIVGKVPQSEYMETCFKKIQELGLSKSFIFVGQKTNPISWIKGGDFAVLPSRSESGPLVLLEYLACGLPFVAFNVGGISNKLNHHLSEYFVDPGNVNEFSIKLSHLIDFSEGDASKNKLLLQNSPIELFNIKNRVQDIEDIYFKIIKDSE